MWRAGQLAGGGVAEGALVGEDDGVAGAAVEADEAGEGIGTAEHQGVVAAVHVHVLLEGDALRGGFIRAAVLDLPVEHEDAAVAALELQHGPLVGGAVDDGAMALGWGVLEAVVVAVVVKRAAGQTESAAGGGTKHLTVGGTEVVRAIVDRAHANGGALVDGLDVAEREGVAGGGHPGGLEDDGAAADVGPAGERVRGVADGVTGQRKFGRAYHDEALVPNKAGCEGGGGADRDHGPGGVTAQLQGTAVALDHETRHAEVELVHGRGGRDQHGARARLAE